MADKRNRNRRKGDQDNDKPCSKEEYAIAKHLRFNCPVRDAKFIPLGSEVKAFVASKAIDTLLESKWAKTTKGDIQFTDRKSCERFMEKLLIKGLFHRALKVERKKKTRKEIDDVGGEEEKEKRTKKEKRSKKDKDTVEKGEKTEEISDEKTEKKDDKKEEDKKKDDDKKKKERKIKVDMHEDQRFIDGDNIYVWIYDPVPAKTFIIGLLMVLGAAALCVFPLWPDGLRVGVYYCSLAGASFVGFILVLVIVRLILFSILWTLTIGKLHFWMLPNLTEDVGFFDSFKPFYKYDFPNKEEEEEKKRLRREKRRKQRENEKPENLKEEQENGDQEPGFEMVQPEDIEDGDSKEARVTEEGEDGIEEQEFNEDEEVNVDEEDSNENDNDDDSNENENDVEEEEEVGESQSAKKDK